MDAPDARIATDPADARRRRLALVGAVFAILLINAWCVYWALVEWQTLGGQTDWRLFSFAADRIAAGLDPYVGEGFAFRWSPVAAWILVPLAQLPFVAWAAVHVLALGLLRPLWVGAVTAFTWPFVLDVVDGGIMIFVAVAALWALRGSRIGTAASLVLALLVPRPLVLPLVAWILWKRPEWRLPFLALFVMHAVLVLATGWSEEWVARLLVSGQDMANALNLSPSRWIGWLWLPIGAAIATALFVRGRPALAGIFLSPYVLPPYLLLAAAELPRLTPIRLPGSRGEPPTSVWWRRARR